MKTRLKLLSLILCVCTALSLVSCSFLPDLDDVRDNMQDGAGDNYIGGDENGGDENGGENNGGSVLPSDKPSGGNTDNTPNDPSGSGNGNDSSASNGLEFTLNSDGASYAVSGIGDCEDRIVTVPATYMGKPVTTIASRAFASVMTMKGIDLPSSLRSIESNAFLNCSGLLYVEIPEGVTYIGSSAFKNAQGLCGVTLPSTLSSIASNAFQYCYKLIEVADRSHLGVTVNSSENGSVGRYAKHIHRGSDTRLVSEGDYIFYVNSADNEYFLVGYQGVAEDITLPTSINGHSYEVYLYALSYLPIKTAVVSDGVTMIGQSAFSSCKTLYKVTLGSTLTDLDASAFHECGKIIEVYNCSMIYNTTVKTTANALNVYSPNSGASKLKTITDFVCYVDPSNSKNYIVEYTGSSKTPVLPENIEGNSYKIYNYAFYKTDIVSVVIPSRVTEIGKYAFAACESLEYVVVPKNVSTIAMMAFAGDETHKCNVYYTGTSSQWNSKRYDDYAVYDAELYYYSETSGQSYWHYVNDVPTPW